MTHVETQETGLKTNELPMTVKADKHGETRHRDTTGETKRVMKHREKTDFHTRRWWQHRDETWMDWTRKRTNIIKQEPEIKKNPSETLENTKLETNQYRAWLWIFLKSKGMKRVQNKISKHTQNCIHPFKMRSVNRFLSNLAWIKELYK